MEFCVLHSGSHTQQRYGGDAGADCYGTGYFTVCTTGYSQAGDSDIRKLGGGSVGCGDPSGRETQTLGSRLRTGVQSDVSGAYGVSGTAGRGYTKISGFGAGKDRSGSGLSGTRRELQEIYGIAVHAQPGILSAEPFTDVLHLYGTGCGAGGDALWTHFL